MNYFPVILKNPKVFIITDNRTHKYFFDKKGWNTLYLTDFKKENDSKYNSSDNFIISMKRHTLIDLKAEKQEAVYNGYSQLIDKYLREK